MPRGNPTLNDFPESERCKGKNQRTGKQCKQKKQNSCDYCLAHDPSERAQIKRTKRAESMHRGNRIKAKAKGVRHKAAKRIIQVANEADAAMDNDLQNNEVPNGIDQVIAFQADLLFRGYEIIEKQVETNGQADFDDILSLLRATAPITKALEVREKLKAKSSGKLVSKIEVLTAMGEDDDDDDTVIVLNDPGAEKQLGMESKESESNEDDGDWINEEGD